jgi:hypothetical protein
MWEELISIAESLVLTDEEDEPVCQFNSTGIYSSQSLYSVINFRGCNPCFYSCCVENCSATQNLFFPLAPVT